MNLHRSLLLSLLLLLSVTGVTAQDKTAGAAGLPSAMVRADFMRVLDDLSSKFVALAEAIPADRYTWRPGEGVRSIGEVLTHVADGNYSFMAMAGIPYPVGVESKSIGALTDKAKIVEVLRQSFDHVRGIYGRMTAADFAKPAKLLRRDTEVREVFFYLITHEPEHMGQLIAYARMVNVTPPWTAERQAKQKKKK